MTHSEIKILESAKLVYTGKIIDLQPIENADFIVSATVVCGEGGKWQGVVRKDQFSIGDLCDVYLPDALVQPNEGMKFLEKSGWRVKMQRFKDAPSEVVIMPIPECYQEGREVGQDMTLWFGVTKYNKPIPVNCAFDVKDHFPDFIPKTDELNYQRCPELVEQLTGKPFYITEKVDGTSCTVYKFKNNFGVCSRRYELIPGNNAYWQIAKRFHLEDNLPDDIAIQFEIAGPKIQNNTMYLKNCEPFLFSAYHIKDKCYLEYADLRAVSNLINMPMAKVLNWGNSFDPAGIEELGEGYYSGGYPREGVVVRSMYNIEDKPISFKVINLGYDN